MGQEFETTEEQHPKEQEEPINPPASSDVPMSIEEDKEEEKVEAPVVKAHYRIGEQVDCQDEVKAWLNAEIVGVKEDKVRVHFTGWHQKFDECIDCTSQRIQPQWKPGVEFKVNNRIDVRDTMNKWLEASIVEVKETSIVVHYKGYTKRWDEELDMTSERIAQIGRFSTSYGSGKVTAKQDKKKKHDEGEESEEDETTKQRSRNMEELFNLKLSEKSMRIKQVGGDGNCLFRSISHQVYGTEDHHRMIRNRCMDYIELEKEFFKQFVVGEAQTIDQYIEMKRRDGTWGDDVEIHAMSEIYEAPIEIYAYANVPMRTFSESRRRDQGRVIRISYHARSHYNSIIDLSIPNIMDRIMSACPGELEELAITKSRIKNNQESIQSIMEGIQEEEKKEGSSLANLLTSNENLIERYKEIVQRSRTEFEEMGVRDMELALEESLKTFNFDREKNELTEEEIALRESKKLYEEELNEDDILQLAMEESLRANEDVYLNHQIANQMEEGMIDNAIHQSQNQFNFDQLRNTPIFQNAKAMGFEDNQIIDAIMSVGNDENMVFSYLLG